MTTRETVARDTPAACAPRTKSIKSRPTRSALSRIGGGFMLKRATKTIRIQALIFTGDESGLRIAEALSIAAQIGVPDWIELDEKGLKGTYKAVPTRDQILPDINEALVVELYSK